MESKSGFKSGKTKVVSSSSGMPRKRILQVLLVLVILGGVFFLGYSYGTNREKNAFADRIASTSDLAIDEGVEVDLFAKTIRITGNKPNDTQTIKDLLNGLSDEDLKKGSYDDLVTAYGLAGTADDQDARARIRAVLKSNKSNFTKAEQETLKGMGI